jgi:hypothetical protein
MWEYLINKQFKRIKVNSLVIAFLIISILIPMAPTPVRALEAPNPLTPADGTETTVNNYPPLGIPEVTWSAVQGAEKYRVQFSPDIGFSSIPIDVQTPNTSYTPKSMTTSLFTDGEWYWRVRVETPGPPGSFSSPMMFLKNWASFDNAPTLTSPSDGFALDFYDSPTFSWDPVTGAARYRFQIALSYDGFSTPTYKVETLATSHQPPSKLENGAYYWRVIPLDKGDHEGTPSEVRSFTLNFGTAASNGRPTLLEPENFTTPTFTPTFHWMAVIGTEKYRLEYTTDPTCDFTTNTTAIETRQTTYTPTKAFPNDQNYCWRVRAQSGKSVGEWSDTWQFQKQWDIKPVLLTPINNYKYGIYPVYSWSPVPGTNYYKIEIDTDGDFQNLFDSASVANPFYTPSSYAGTISSPYYWRVIPYDGSNNEGVASDVLSFKSFYTSTAPVQIYPFYYYLPNDPNYYGDVELNPYEDRTVPYPIFMWQRVFNPHPMGGLFSDAYRVEVDTTPLFTLPLEWSFDTENTSAVPTFNENFTPQVGQDYFWRVCPLNSLGGNCLKNPINGDTWWSQIWRTRFDTSLGHTPTSGTSPQLIRPVHSREIVETTPLFEWWPYQDATLYQIRISRFSDLSSPLIDETTPYPAYTPENSLAQRSLNKLGFGTFYWGVRAYLSGAWGNWSDAWRFQIASQSEYINNRTIGNTTNRLQIGYDPDDVDQNYELTRVYSAQSNENWYFGFNANTDTTDMTYVLYLDLDHIDGSGADTIPVDRNYNVSTIAAHQPEYAIYIDQVNGSFNLINIHVYEWLGSNWYFPKLCTEIYACDVYYSGGYLEIQIPDTAIGMSDINSSISLSVYSVNISNGNLIDSVPSDPNVPGSGELSRFSAVSESMNPIFPPDHGGGDTRTFSSIFPFYWDYPTGSSPTTPWAGSILEVYIDPDFSTKVGEIGSVSNAAYFASPQDTFYNDIQGDNTYYWRMRPRYYGSPFGSWVNAGSFERKGFVPQNLSTSVTFATPTFSWDMVEGAATYDLQVSKDPNFGSTVVNVSGTPQNTYTPTSTMPNDVYYWRVRARRYGNIANDWSTVETFTLNLPKPSNLTPDDPQKQYPVNYAPSMCWDHIIEYKDSVPVLTAWKYRIQVSKDPSFSSIFDTKDTEQPCYTPTKGYDDGTYYWRVAMIDGNNRLGEYSDPAEFTKQYPITTLVSPISGGVPTTPTFIWTPVFGAATYKLEISLYSGFSPTYDSVETVNTQYTPIKEYDMDRRYYWRVAIRDRDGKYGPYTDATIIVGEYNPIFLPIINRTP